MSNEFRVAIEDKGNDSLSSAALPRVTRACGGGLRCHNPGKDFGFFDKSTDFTCLISYGCFFDIMDSVRD